MPYLKSFSFGPFQTNTFLLGADSAKDAVLIDAPPESYDDIKAVLKDDGRSLAAVLITHPHFDHVMDAAKFSTDGIPIIALEEAVEGIAQPNAMGLYPMDSNSVSGARVTQIVRAGDRLHFAGLEFEVFEVPGHSIGSAAFYLEKESLCCVGDLIFCGSVGRTDLDGGSFDRLAESIRKHIYTLSDDTVLLPGHGPLTNVGSERSRNPFVCG